MATVHCLGVLVVDALSGPLAQYPVPGVTTQVNTASIQFRAGGGAANTASALGQLGVPVSVFSKLGADMNGRFLRSELQRNRVEVQHLVEVSGENTPFTFVGVHPNGERSFIHTPGCNLTFCREDIDLGVLYDCRYLFYQDMWVLPKLDGPASAEILAEAQRQGVVTLLDECYGLGPKADVFERALPYCDVVLPSYDDMRVIYPGLGPGDVAARLLDLGARRVVLKLGQDGCLVSNGKGSRRIPSAAKEIIDTTGAGDCFDAGFIAGLANGLDDFSAAELGSRVAAACIRHVGGAVGIPTFEALMKSL